MKILVPSYKRANDCPTMEMIPSAQVVVPESQKEEYEANFPDRVIAIPDKRDGSVAKKRNATLELVGEGELFWLLDDDLQQLIRLKSEDNPDIEKTLFNHWQCMEDLGCDFGGFSVSSDPIKYREFAPFSMTKPSYGAVCLRRSHLRYDEELKIYEDVDYFLQVMKHKRQCFRDNRFFMQFACNKDKENTTQAGGVEYQSEKHDENLQKLLSRWGDCIKIKNGKVNGVKIPVKGI